MDRRTLVALALMALVIVLVPRLFPKPPRPVMSPADSAVAAAALRDTGAMAIKESTSPSAVGAAGAQRSVAQPATLPAIAAESTVLAGQRARMTLVSPGAVPSSVRLADYLNLRPGRHDTMVVTQQRGPLLSFRIARDRDTIALDTVRFSVQTGESTTTLSSLAPAITVTYQSVGDGYRTAVRGSVSNAPSGSALIIDLPRDFRTSEADTLDNLRHLAYAYKIPLREVTSVPFSKLDTLVRTDTGTFQWVSARDKYWLIALMKPVGSPGAAGIFHGITMRGDTAIARIKRTAAATTTLPLTNGQFAFDLYVGPQSWQQLHALGNELENVNQYAGFFHPIVQPFATIVLRVLLWMRTSFKLSYGWVLVVFGITIRLLMWPLNQKAMRTGVRMQRIQPELTALQKRYKDDPDKQREAMMKLYQEHGMSPLSPLLGCFPMLLPLPVLWALYFVFQNTIEFRGVHFLWLPDISLRDPYYITPIVMGASMFLLSWIGMRSAPPNPQSKMMSYMMPAMFTVMFLNFASGLNLYYAVQNIAALPQQWIVSRERAKAGVGATGAKPGGGAGGTKRNT